MLTWKDSAGTPIDVTGCTGRMQIRPSVESPTVLAELSSTNDGVAFGGANGIVALHIPAAQTAAFAWRSGVYDLEVAFPDGTVRRLLYGSVVVSPEVTR